MPTPDPRPSSRPPPNAARGRRRPQIAGGETAAARSQRRQHARRIAGLLSPGPAVNTRRERRWRIRQHRSGGPGRARQARRRHSPAASFTGSAAGGGSGYAARSPRRPCRRGAADLRSSRPSAAALAAPPGSPAAGRRSRPLRLRQPGGFRAWIGPRRCAPFTPPLALAAAPRRRPQDSGRHPGEMGGSLRGGPPGLSGTVAYAPLGGGPPIPPIVAPQAALMCGGALRLAHPGGLWTRRSRMNTCELPGTPRSFFPSACRGYARSPATILWTVISCRSVCHPATQPPPPARR
jgi:hypothetical protein